MFIATNTWSAQIAILEYIDMGYGSYRMYCVSHDDSNKGYKYMSGLGAGSAMTQMLDDNGPVMCFLDDGLKIFKGR